VRAVLTIALLGASALGQNETFSKRFEFASRLRSLESAWIAHTQAEVRTQAVRIVERAGTAYFAGDVTGAMDLLDEARGLLVPRRMRWAQCLTITPARRLVDVDDRTLLLKLEQVYPCNDWRSFCLLGEAIDDNAQFGPIELKRLLGQAPEEGEFHETLDLFDGDFEWYMPPLHISIVERRDERLAAVKAAIEAASAKGPKLEVGTAEMLSGLLNSLASGSTEAHEYPGARLLDEAEQVVAAAAKGERWYGPQRDGEYWLALPVGDASVRARVFVPQGLSREKPAPLVLALHGRAFDEDTWFDGYGCGQSVELCRRRGWLLAAPRCDGNEDAAKLDAIAKALGEAYPIDSKRVLLVGHSRGGGSVLKALTQAPEHFRAAATIGAALAPDESKPLAKLPLFLAAGDHDFAREGVEAMHAALIAAGSTTATFKLCPNTEHWLAVTDALPDAFAWFDAQLK